MSPWALWLSMILLIGTGIAADVPFVFDETSSGVANYNSDQLEQVYAASSDLAGVPMVTQATDDEVIAFPITGGGSTPEGEMENNVGELKKAFDARVEPENRRVNREAVVLAGKYPGDRTIDQISSIYSYLKNGWGYVADTRGIDNFRYANETLELGNLGDCDDFAILMSALIESIGGTTRIILARNSSIGGHAYTEVYLGKLDAQNSQVENIIDWLKQEFNTDKIYTHIDTATKDVWLNLDWGPDEKGNTHPGGPFFQGDKHIVLCIRDTFTKTALKVSSLNQEKVKQEGTTAAPAIISFPNIQTNPLQEGYGNVKATLFGAIRTPLQDKSSTQETLTVNVGLIGTENATYELLDQWDITYSPILYKNIQPGRQLVSFLIPQDELFKLIKVVPARGSPFNIKWWATPKGSNDNLVVRYYGITDYWLVNPNEQSIVIQLLVQNAGTRDFYIAPEDFALLDQSGKVYHPTLGFEPEVVAPQNATTTRVKVIFTGISLMSKVTTIAYDYGKPDQIVIDLEKDQQQLSDELAYGTLAVIMQPEGSNGTDSATQESVAVQDQANETETKKLSIMDKLAASKARLAATRQDNR